jgi:hypothetical protein
MFQEDVTLTDRYNCPNNNAINAEHAQLVNYSTEHQTHAMFQDQPADASRLLMLKINAKLVHKDSLLTLATIDAFQNKTLVLEIKF